PGSPCVRRCRALRVPSCALTTGGQTAPALPGRSARSEAARPSARAGSPPSTVARPALRPRGREGNKRWESLPQPATGALWHTSVLELSAFPHMRRTRRLEHSNSLELATRVRGPSRLECGAVCGEKHYAA